MALFEDRLDPRGLSLPLCDMVKEREVFREHFFFKGKSPEYLMLCKVRVCLYSVRGSGKAWSSGEWGTRGGEDWTKIQKLWQE